MARSSTIARYARSFWAKGHRFRTGSDMEVIVHGYEEWGDRVTERVNGQFAFALWDASRRRLLAARDRAGEKPLYYYDGGAGEDVVFASEIKSLLARAQVPRELNAEALDCFLTYEFIIAPLSIFKGVKKLPPAHAMSVENGEVKTWPYWSRRPTSSTDAVTANGSRSFGKRSGARCARR